MRMKKWFGLFLALCLIFSICGIAEEAAPALEKDVMILFTSDVHCGIDRGWGYAGLYEVKENLAKKYHVLLVDDGDAIQGEPVGTMTTGEAIIDINKAPYKLNQNDRAGIYKGRGSSNYNATDSLLIQYQGGVMSSLYIDQVQNPFAAVYYEQIDEYYDFTMGGSRTMKELAGHLPYERRSHMLICHYFNAANLMPVVEVSRFGEVLPEVADEVTALYQSVGKHVIPVLKDVPGMVVNRIQIAVFREALHMIDEGITTVEDLDTALMYATGFRYMAIGILGGYDLAALDQGMYTANKVFPSLCNDDHVKEGSLLWRKNQEGKIGIKAHEGFYQYDPEKEGDVQADFIRKLVLQRVQAKRLHGDNMKNVGSWNVH